jgi:hypothetical protein
MPVALSAAVSSTHTTTNQPKSNNIKGTAKMGSSGNGQDPNTYCTTCNSTIKTDPNTGVESGHESWCEWNPKNQ